MNNYIIKDFSQQSYLFPHGLPCPWINGPSIGKPKRNRGKKARRGKGAAKNRNKKKFN